jgi:hypothetical protein
MKMNKKAFKIHTFEKAADHQSNYRGLSEDDKKDLF